MTTLWAVMKMEWRLTWRQPTFWMIEIIILIAPLISSYILLTGLGMLHFIWPSFALIGSLIPILLLQALFMPLIVSPAVRRDLDQPGEVLWATPLDGAIHMLGVAGGLWLSFQPLFLAQTALLYGLNHWFAVGESELFWLHWFLALNSVTTAWLSGALLVALFVPRTLLMQILWVPLVFYLWGRLPLSSSLMSEESTIFSVYYPLDHSVMLALLGAGLLGLVLAIGASLLLDPRRAVGIPFLKRKDAHEHSY